jgi:hypothetical protein
VIGTIPSSPCRLLWARPRAPATKLAVVRHDTTRMSMLHDRPKCFAVLVPRDSRRVHMVAIGDQSCAWPSSNAAVEQLLALSPRGSRVLGAPGRFHRGVHLRSSATCTLVIVIGKQVEGSYAIDRGLLGWWDVCVTRCQSKNGRVSASHCRDAESGAWACLFLLGALMSLFSRGLGSIGSEGECILQA